MVRLAIIDDEPAVLRNLKRRAEKSGYEVEAFSDPVAAMAAMEKKAFNIVLSDLRMPGLTGFEVLERVKALSRETQVIIMTGYGSVSTAVDLVKQGAFYYLEKPFSPDQAMLILHRAAKHLGLADENRRLKKDLESGRGQTRIIGISRSIREMIKFIHKVAQVDCNVLIQGESGTGKELIARAIHDYSPRKDKPFVSFNCGAFSEDLVVNELFGHEKGAFTGADREKPGLFETAQNGTVFLDEIGEAPLSMQVKLLRLLQEKEILRVGGTRPVDLNVRILSATNRELEHEVTMAKFREDLYFRPKVVTIRAPALRERKEDIPVLTEHFLKRYNAMYNKNIRGFTRRARSILNQYSFPGNVRELEHIISSAVALSDDDWLDEKYLPSDLGCLEVETISPEKLVPLWENEREHIIRVLEATNYNKVQAAEILEIPRTTLWRKIKKYKIANIVD
ncbi:MAG: sigma-54-dependent transcriptional regulator [Desulfonatronovibrionaceae bacterium]